MDWKDLHDTAIRVLRDAEKQRQEAITMDPDNQPDLMGDPGPAEAMVRRVVEAIRDVPLTSELRARIIRCEEELSAQRMGEPTADPALPWRALLDTIAAAAIRRRGA